MHSFVQKIITEYLPGSRLSAVRVWSRGEGYKRHSSFLQEVVICLGIYTFYRKSQKTTVGKKCHSFCEPNSAHAVHAKWVMLTIWYQDSGRRL